MNIRNIIRKSGLSALTSLMFAAVPAIDAGAQSHEKLFSLSGGFNTRNTSGVAGVHFTYGLNSWLRISPSASYIFKHEGIDAFTINADCHFAFRAASSPLTFYPIAGLGYWSWNNSTQYDESVPLNELPPDEESDDVSSRSTQFCINMGGGMQWSVTPTLTLTFEGKYALMRHNPTAVFSLGIGYRF